MVHPQLGTYICNFTEHKVIPLHTKVIILTMLWTSLIFCVYVLTPIWFKCLMLTIAIGVTFHILSYKSEA